MSNYSFATSLPPYQERSSEKKRQADELFAFIRRGANNLLQLSELSGLPQSTVSGRISDLQDEGKIEYSGFTVFRDRKRKKIVVKPILINGIQEKLF